MSSHCIHKVVDSGKYKVATKRSCKFDDIRMNLNKQGYNQLEIHRHPYRDICLGSMVHCRKLASLVGTGFDVHSWLVLVPCCIGIDWSCWGWSYKVNSYSGIEQLQFLEALRHLEPQKRPRTDIKQLSLKWKRKMLENFTESNSRTLTLHFHNSQNTKNKIENFSIFILRIFATIIS